MLEAFILGFWVIWSADRDIRPLSEGFWFTLLAAVIRHLMTMELPEVDASWAVFNGAIWVYVGLVLFIVARFSNNFMTTLLMAAAAGVGYFQMMQHLPEWVAAWVA